jgi:ketosteroid isomerase-like protein
MKKKNGFNIMLFVFIIILFMILSCKNYKNKLEGILLQTDQDFSFMSEKEGMFKAFLFYIADEGVILRDNSYPAKGRKTLKEYFSGKSDTSFILTWKPVFEKISENGDIGYTYGIHTTLDKATGRLSSGTYVTVWQKEKDGTWKFILDTGTQGLPENLK